MFLLQRKLSTSCFTNNGPTSRETMDRLAVNRWPSLREIRTGPTAVLDPATGKPPLDAPLEYCDSDWHTEMDAVGISNSLFHDLRHATASMRAAQGCSLPKWNGVKRSKATHPKSVEKWKGTPKRKTMPARNAWTPCGRFSADPMANPKKYL